MLPVAEQNHCISRDIWIFFDISKFLFIPRFLADLVTTLLGPLVGKHCTRLRSASADLVRLKAQRYSRFPVRTKNVVLYVQNIQKDGRTDTRPHPTSPALGTGSCFLETKRPA